MQVYKDEKTVNTSLSPKEASQRIASALQAKRDLGFSPSMGWYAFPYRWWHLWITVPELEGKSAIPFNWFVGQIDGPLFQILKIRLDLVVTPVRLVGTVEEADGGSKVRFHIEKNRNVQKTLLALMLGYIMFYLSRPPSLILSIVGFGIGLTAFELILKRDGQTLVDFLEKLFADVKK